MQVMHTRAPMLQTLSTFAVRDGKIKATFYPPPPTSNPSLDKQTTHILNLPYPKNRNPLPLDRPLSLHPPPINLQHRPFRPLQHPRPEPTIKIPHRPALLRGHHRRRGAGRRAGRGRRQPGGGDPRPHVRRRGQATGAARQLPGRAPGPVADRS
jgi:hypothetical protein